MSSTEFSIPDEAEARLVKEYLSENLPALDEESEGRDVSIAGSSLNKKEPEDALEEYLADKKREMAAGTYRTHKSRLSFFVDWCCQEGEDGSRRIEYLSELNGQDLKEFRDWRRSESEWEVTTEESQMKTLRVFLRFCEKPEWVPESLPQRVPIPKVDSDEETRDESISQDRVDDILNHLEAFEYASLEHCIWIVMGRTGCRISGVRALDWDDYEQNDETEKAILKFRSRKNTGTRLKNGSSSDRNIEIDEEAQSVIDDYIEHQRRDVVDEYDREPLFTTENGRPSTSVIRKYAYKWSRPCEITNECPFDRDISKCEAAGTGAPASRCPDSVSPHPIRRGRITWHLNQGALPQMISTMYDVSPDIMKKHYDDRSLEDKQRLASIWKESMDEILSKKITGSDFR